MYRLSPFREKVYGVPGREVEGKSLYLLEFHKHPRLICGEFCVHPKFLQSTLPLKHRDDDRNSVWRVYEGPQVFAELESTAAVPDESRVNLSEQHRRDTDIWRLRIFIT